MQPEDGFSGIAGNDLVSLLNPEQAGEGAETACSYGKTVCVVFYFCNSVLVALLIPNKVSPAILTPGRTFICNFARIYWCFHGKNKVRHGVGRNIPYFPSVL